MTRFQESMSTEEKSQHESDTEFVVSQSSKASKDLFSKNDVVLVKKGFAAILHKASVKDKEMKMAVATNAVAKSIAGKFKHATIKNRLKYEIRKARSEKKFS
eukprot:Seg6277.2 transcript_id=Seg6277.2/GoldUCD/mRNA.D3Y31 product="hypothetical protein" protein_id=Seg6277.2/GoldUCD/D3Y31